MMLTAVFSGVTTAKFLDGQTVLHMVEHDFVCKEKTKINNAILIFIVGESSFLLPKPVDDSIYTTVWKCIDHNITFSEMAAVSTDPVQ